MKLHNLKIMHHYKVDVDSGRKKAELRKNDRDYQVDDLIRFTEVFADGHQKICDELWQITHILKDVPQYGLKPGYCILSIEKIGKYVSWPAGRKD